MPGRIGASCLRCRPRVCSPSTRSCRSFERCWRPTIRRENSATLSWTRTSLANEAELPEQGYEIGDRVEVHLDSKSWEREGWFPGTVVRIEPYSEHRSFY